MSDYDFLYKVLLVGDSGVGKSSLLVQFVDRAFCETFISTIGVDFKIRTIRVHDRTVKLQIWDTAGQERFRTICASYYRGAHGILLAYDVTSFVSFEHISNWMAEITRYAQPTAVKVLVGNKIDLLDKRAVTTVRGREVAERNGMAFAEVSARDATGVDGVFALLADGIFKRDAAARLAERKGTEGIVQLSENGTAIPDPLSGSSRSCC